MPEHEPEPKLDLDERDVAEFDIELTAEDIRDDSRHALLQAALASISATQEFLHLVDRKDRRPQLVQVGDVLNASNTVNQADRQLRRAAQTYLTAVAQRLAAQRK